MPSDAKQFRRWWDHAEEAKAYDRAFYEDVARLAFIAGMTTGKRMVRTAIKRKQTARRAGGPR